MKRDKKLKKDEQKKTCMVGIGNVLRSDDGAGAYVCKQMEKLKLPGVSFISIHQLDIGIAEDLSKFDTVIFVDASFKDEPVSFFPLTTGNNEPQSFSHQLNAGMLSMLVKQLYKTNTRFHICAIGADNLEMGCTLSEKTMNNALEAVSLLTAWIKLND